jgi:hypothetical protein
MSCAGIHREFNNKVKSLGHATFTNEEVEMMKQTDNDKVNAMWLASYDVGKERMKPPDGNQDQDLLRAWIRRKYQDKQWYEGSSGGDIADGGPGGGSQQLRGGVGSPPQPTIVQIPPQSVPSATAPSQVDLFANFNVPAAAPSSNHVKTQTAEEEDDWAGFGGSSQHNFANFGSGNSTDAAKSDPFAQVPSQQQIFANFGEAPNSTTESLARAQLPGGDGQQQQQQQGNQSFINSAASASLSHQQLGGFAKFESNQSPSAMSHLQPLSDPFANSHQQHSQQGGFANFNQPPQQMLQYYPPQGGGFGVFNEQQQHFAQPLQDQQQATIPTSGQGFANFDQTQQQSMSQPPLTHALPVLQSNNNISGNANQMHGQDPFASIPQQQPQPTMSIIPPSQGTNTPHLQDPLASVHHQQQQEFAAFQSPHVDAMEAKGLSQLPPPPQQQLLQPPSSQQQMQQPLTEASAMNYGPKDDPMDAFAHLSMNGSTNNDNNNLAVQEPAGQTSTLEQTEKSSPEGSNFAAGQIVCYKSIGDRMKAKIVKVHLDDELRPYYTILLPFGKEKQTGSSHLSVLDPSFLSIEAKLLTFSATELKQVENFIAGIDSGRDDDVMAPQSTVASLPARREETEKVDHVPTSVHSVSPSGMSHISQLTQIPANQLQMPTLSMQPQVPTGTNIGMANPMMNGGGPTNLSTISSPTFMDQPAASIMGAGHILAPPETTNMTGPEQHNMNEMTDPQLQQQSTIGIQHLSQQSYPPSNMGMNPMQVPQQQNMGIPSPVGMPSSAQLQGIAGQVSAPPLAQQLHHPQSMGQQQMMQGQVNIQPQAPSMIMMMAQPVPLLQQQPPPHQQMVNGPMGGGQPQMSQLPQGQMTQFQQQQTQMPAQPSQVPQSPQGNPFDMY